MYHVKSSSKSYVSFYISTYYNYRIDMMVKLFKDKFYLSFFLIGIIGFLFPFIDLYERESLSRISVHTFFLLIILFPIIEECLFRGVLHSLLLKINLLQNRLLTISFANFLTSILFVLMHFFNHPPLWALLVIVPSIIYGYFRERFNHLLPPILLHIWYNFIYFILISSDF